MPRGPAWKSSDDWAARFDANEDRWGKNRAELFGGIVLRLARSSNICKSLRYPSRYGKPGRTETGFLSFKEAPSRGGAGWKNAWGASHSRLASALYL